MPCASRFAILPHMDSRTDIDTDRIDEAVLALLWLNLSTTGTAWKGFDWNAMDRLHERGLISDPARKAKSVHLTDEGMAEAERLFNALFARPRILPRRCESHNPAIAAGSAEMPGASLSPVLPARPTLAASLMA